MKKIILLVALFLFTVSNSQTSYQDTQGKLEISNSGSAVYTLPIAMPPSIQDVGPVINLIYSSGQMGGIAGQGWNINSISTISRIATRKDIDGYIDGVDFDSNDMLALDGQRLLIKSGSYWAAGAVYQTETQSNSRIEQVGTGTNMHFIVTAPDGSRSWYGNYGGMNAVDNTAYYITRFEDTNGNYMTYQYVKPFNKSLCIQKINFSANSISGIAPQNRIEFSYKPAKRTESVFIKGIKQEKGETLEQIEVYTNSLLFRKYQLTHSIDTQLGYEKVIKIQESNGAGEMANPVEFDYISTSSSSGPQTVIIKSYDNTIDFQDVKFSGDFDGDGGLDFVTDDKLYTKNFEGNTTTAPIDIPFDINQRTCLVGTTLNTINKLNQHQSIIKVLETTSTISFKIYDLVNNTLTNTNQKNISINNTGNVLNCTNYGPINGPFPYLKDSNLYYEGDFNGDGKSDVLMISTINEKKVNGYSGNTGTCIQVTETNTGIQYSIIDISDNQLYGGYYTINNTFVSGDKINTVYIENPNSNVKNNLRYISDFNGDGKSDLLLLNPNDKSYKIISFNNIDSGSLPKTIEVIGNGILDSFTETKQMLFGDYNGDGKTDIMLPNTEGGAGSGHAQWHIYYANPNPSGGSFFTKESHTIVEYRPNSGNDYSTQIHYSNYYALDVNKDGKTDMVRLWRKRYKPGWTVNDHDTQWKVFSFVNNIGNTQITGNKFTADYVSPCVQTQFGEVCGNYSDSPEMPTPIASTYRYNGLNRELLLVRNHTNKLVYIDFTKDVGKDILLSKVTSSGGTIVDKITYGYLEPSAANNYQGTLNSLYSSGDAVTYPLVEIKRLPESFVVAKLTNTSVGVTKHQDFKYHGFVTNMNGIGAIGFRKTARSSWYVNPSAKKIWSVFEMDPSLRGATTRTYTQLVDSGVDFSFVTSGNPTGIINSTSNTFTTSFVNGLYSITLNTQTTQDFLTNVKNELTYSYSSPYNLEETVVSKNYLATVLQGTSTTTKEYDDNPTGAGSTYYIGRPKKVTSSVSAYSDTFSTEEKYTYTGSRLTKTEKKGNNTDGIYLTEDFEYFANGNLKKKTLSAPGAVPAVSPRVTEFTYDTSERFIKTSKDIEGLISTNTTYHPIYGVVTKTTNPFGLTTDSEYDNWGKRTKITDYLGKNTYYSYTKSNGVYTTLQTADDGSSSKVESDALGRTFRKGTKLIDGTWSYVDTEYDFLNRKKRESEPYLAGGSANQWTTITYDDYSRVIQTVAPSGLTNNAAYVGLTVTTTDGTKTSSVTKNANGHAVSTTDNGGAVTNAYYANGNLKSATYDGTVVSMEYDGWGRKTKLTDPSAGVYQYEYNIYGETTKEITPNGTTVYELTPVGKIDSSYSTGSNTSQATDYYYDPISKLQTRVESYDTNTGEAYEKYFSYDAQKRLNKTVEYNVFTYHETQLEYDAFGRVSREYKKAVHNTTNKTSAKWTKNIYKNGYHWQILDDATNQILWQTNTVNARGQLLTANIGNGIAITNTYDQYGFPTQFKHDKTSPSVSNIMTLNTAFEPQRGNLTSRYSSLFYQTDNFQYDNLDRLTNYPNHLGQTVQQTYETDGRIKQNILGTYEYSNSAKKYQNSRIKAETNVIPYYENRAGIFNDDFEKKSGWAIYEPTVVTFDATVAKTGTTSLKINNTGTGEKVVYSEVWTRINNAVATQYTYSGWVKSTGPQAEVVLFMKTENETNFATQADQIIVSAGSNWVYFEKTVLVPANIKKFNMRLDNNGAGTVWFDDIRIRKTSDVLTAPRELNITYNIFKGPVEIEETNVDRISFEYNHLNQRGSMFYGGLQADKLLRQYRKHYTSDGSMEVKHNTLTNEVEFVTYIGGDGYSAPVVLKSNGTTQEYLYLHRDYQGSIVAITNESGNIVEKRSFDAWGEVVRVEDGQGNVLAGFAVLDRGYTGHEHLQSVGLIHMNGRLYDAKLHRFLQPDNFIQDPSNTQNFNRYSYVLNNTLKYTDPSGEEFLTAVLIGAAIAAFSYTMVALTADVPFTFGGLLQSVAVGAFSGAVTFGVSEYVNTICGFTSKAVGFWNGAFMGATNGFTTGVTGTVLGATLNGGSIKLMSVIKGGVIGAAVGGVIRGIDGGLRAQEGNSNFWTGKKELDLSKGFGAHGVSDNVMNSTVKAKYVGKYEGINVFEHESLGVGNLSGGMTLPPDKIIIGKGAFKLLENNKSIQDLMHHEFGHILQARQSFVGLDGFYSVIAPESLASATMDTYKIINPFNGMKHNHQMFWTETWANKLSIDYFGNVFNDVYNFRGESLSFFNYLKFFVR